MLQISNEKLAHIISITDSFYRSTSVFSDPDVECLDILFGYGEHVSTMIRNGYKLQTQTDGVSCVISVLENIVDFYSADKTGVIDIYVLESIVDSGGHVCKWFKSLLGEKERHMLDEFQKFDRVCY